MNTLEEDNIIPMPTIDHHPSAISAPTDYSGQGAAGVSNLDKVRDILFGTQMRDYDRRFARLEERLIKEAAEAREDTRRRFDSLETFIKQEIAALNDRLKSENHQRTRSDEDLIR